MDKPTYLYHGTMRRVELLKPHQAYDWGHEEGRQYAVYATSNRDVALAFALGAVPDEAGNCARVIRPQDMSPLRMVFWKGHPNFGGKGYLYTLGSEGFVHAGGDQWVCPDPVKPIEILEIEVDDYLHLFRYVTEEEKAELQQEYEKQKEELKRHERQNP